MKLSALTSSSFWMTSGLLVATLTATAHHCFYSKVNQHIVQDLNEQEWFSRIGTGLAFAVKTLLTASAGLAYTQLLWNTLRRKSFTLKGLDALFAVVNDVWKFWNWEVWRYGLALILIAVLIWTVPIVAIFTPGTLTVQQAIQPKESVVDLAIPLIGYDTFRHFAQWGGAGGNYYSAPSNRLSRLLTTVTSQGSIVPLKAPFPNSTYSIEFFGPSISCGPPTSFNDSDVAQLIKNYTRALGGSSVQYVGFVPRYYETQLAATLEGLNNTLQDNQYTGTFDIVSEDHARLYVAVPSLNESSYVADTVIECGLYNSSFQVDFAFNNGQQDTKVNNMKRLNGVNSRLSYGNQCDTISEQRVICSAAETVYIAILDALGTQLVGRIDQSHYGPISATRTQVINSVLMDTQELGRMQERVDETLLSSHETPTASDKKPLSIANTSMADALEQLFVNITLSLFSDSYFLQNQTVATTKPVHIFTPQNAYVYKPRNLLIAYYTSVVATAVVVIASLISIARADSKTFESSFSTILRTTRNPELDELMELLGSTASKPLSNKHLAQTKLRLLDRQAVMSDVETANDKDGPEPRSVFMIVEKADPLVGQGPEWPGQEMRMADVDSLLVLEGDSH